jgi:hypothetical protein
VRDHRTPDLGIQHAFEDKVIRVNCCTDDLVHAVVAGVRVTDRFMGVDRIGYIRFLNRLPRSQRLRGGEYRVLNRRIPSATAEGIF